MPEQYSYPFYQVSFPQEYVLHAGKSFIKCAEEEINRPQSLNAFNTEYAPRLRYPSANSSLMNQTANLFNKASTDPDVRVVILSARGKGFSAGLDCISSTPLLMISKRPEYSRTTSSQREARHSPDSAPTQRPRQTSPSLYKLYRSLHKTRHLRSPRNFTRDCNRYFFSM